MTIPVEKNNIILIARTKSLIAHVIVESTCLSEDWRTIRPGAGRTEFGQDRSTRQSYAYKKRSPPRPLIRPSSNRTAVWTEIPRPRRFRGDPTGLRHRSTRKGSRTRGCRTSRDRVAAAAARERPQWSADGPDPSQPTWGRTARTLRRNTRSAADKPRTWAPPSLGRRRSRKRSTRRKTWRLGAAAAASPPFPSAGARPPHVRVAVVQTHVGPAAAHSSRVPCAEQSSRSGRASDGTGSAFSGKTYCGAAFSGKTFSGKTFAGKTFAVDRPHAAIVTCNIIVIVISVISGRSPRDIIAIACCTGLWRSGFAGRLPVFDRVSREKSRTSNFYDWNIEF